MTPDYTISDLRAVPGFSDTVADRIWRAWWQEDGVPLAELRARLDESFGKDPIPSTFVAHRGGLYLGSVVLIENDLVERPALRPWVAALWVEPAQRRQGIGAALATRAANTAFAAGHARAYLCANAANAPYYVRSGWSRIESDVGGLDVFALERR